MHQMTEGMYTSFDGTKLFYRVWKPLGHLNKKSVIVLHRGHEHSGRVTNVVEGLAKPDLWFFSFDLRGHGRSPGERGWAKNFNVWVKDLNAFANFIQTEFDLPQNEMTVVANSVGAVMTAAWVHDYAPPLKGMILAAPAFDINLYIPFALQTLRQVLKFTDKLFVKSYVRSNLLTRDPIEAQGYDQDPLITKKIAVSVLVTLFDLSKRIISDAKAIEIPTLIFSAGSDFVVKRNAQKKFFDNLSSRYKKFVDLPKYRHAIFHDQGRADVFKQTSQFLDYCYTINTNLPAIRQEARAFSIDEYSKLFEKPTLEKSIFYYVLRKALKILGKYSNGMAIGLEHGFDSGASLDYIYLNKSSGKNFVGYVLDLMYLNALGWRGVRLRKEMLKSTLQTISQKLNFERKDVLIMDIASGHGRYLVETAKSLDFNIGLHLQDISQKNLDNAKAIALGHGLNNVTFRQADAFQLKNYQSNVLRPNIVVVSGLFELFQDNNSVLLSLSGIHQNLQDDGYIVYTGQPWHPQIEIISRVLNNHQNKRWIMRRRIQAEIDGLVEAAGFEKISGDIEDNGIFTVSVAKKKKQFKEESPY